MSKLMTETPVFVDTLAAAAGCSPAEAEAHFTTLALGDNDDTMMVQSFIEHYGTPQAQGPAPVPDTAG